MSALTVGIFVGDVIRDSRTRNDTLPKVTMSLATMVASAKLLFWQIPKLTVPEYFAFFVPTSFAMGAAAYSFDSVLEMVSPNLNPTTRHLEAGIIALVLQGAVADSAQGLPTRAILASSVWRLFLAQGIPLTWEGLSLLKRKISQLLT